MATRNPRLAVTLDKPTLLILAKLATLQKRSRSAIAADLLQEMTPTLERIAKLLEAAIVNRATLPANTAARLEGMQELLGSIATLSLDHLDDAVQPAPKGARSAPRRRSGH